MIALPLAAGMGRLVGQLAFELPLPLELPWLAMLGWSVGAHTPAALAPADAATRLSVRAALGHV